MKKTFLLISSLALLACSYAQPLSNPRALSKKDMPLVFLQSGYLCDDAGGWDVNGPLGRVYTKAERKAYIRMWSKLYNSIEYSAVSFQDSFQLAQLRTQQLAFKEASQESGKNFFGILDITRPPGFYQPADIAAQPLSYRAVSLKSNGALWYRKVDGSIFDFLGSFIDLGNTTARQAMLSNMATAFSATGNVSTCIGPIYGFVMLSEAKLTPVYSPDTTDFAPLGPGNTLPDLRGGNPYTLYFDGNLENSFFIPPKRAVPLYSQNAKNRFVAFAQAHGLTVTKLPADRNEFNDLDATVSLPAWVEFVPLTNTQEWKIWEDWIAEEWTGFCIDVARTITLAQGNNTDFKGVLYFQLPLWYSIPQASQNPITYSYYDTSGVLKTVTETMKNYSEYKWLNASVMGLDVEKLMADSNMVGFIHESTCSVPNNGYQFPDTNRFHREHYAAMHDRRIHYHFAQGALCQQVCRQNGKYFGWFIRDVWFDGVLNHFERLDATEMENGMIRELPVMDPDIISALLPGNVYDIDSAYAYLISPYIIENQAFRDKWFKQKTKFDTNYVAPLWENPYSLGFVDVSNDSMAYGWSYDPWSDSTDVEVILLGGPCSTTYPKSLGTFSLNITSTPGRIAAISNFVVSNAAYTPPASITKFDYSINLSKYIQQHLPSCPAGTYSVTLRVTDKQGARWHDMDDLSHAQNGTVLVIKTSTTTGVNTFEAPSFSIFPNPSAGTFSVNGIHEHTELKLFNMFGECVFRSAGSEDHVMVDIPEAGSGMYFLQLTNEHGTAVKKISINK